MSIDQIPPDELALMDRTLKGSPLTDCTGQIIGASRRILDRQPLPLNGRLLASGIAWSNTETRRYWR